MSLFDASIHFNVSKLPPSLPPAMSDDPAPISLTDIRKPYKYLLERKPVHLSLNFVDLYEVEIVDRLACASGYWKCFEPILGPDAIKQALDDDYNNAEAFYKKLRHHERNALLYRCVVDFFAKIDTDLYRSMNTKAWVIECKEMFHKVLNVIHDIRPLTEIRGTIRFITTVSFELARDYQPVLDRLEAGEITEDYAKSLVFRTLPLISDASAYHMFFGIWVSNEKSHAYIDDIMPEFDIFYQLNYADVGAGVVHMVRCLEDVEEAVKTIMDNPAKNEYAKDFFYDRLPDNLTMPLHQKTTNDKPLRMRSYQMELAVNAIKEDNVVIVAPTGTGKTIIATYIIRHHIFELKRTGKKPKVAFVVPSTPLVNQQCDVFKLYLSSMARIIGINGGSVGIADVFNAYDIFVVTPMIIVNALHPDSLLGDNPLPFSIGDLTMIVLDEVHHTNKLHPYNELMNEYRKHKYGNEIVTVRYAPKVVGFTASVGAPPRVESIQQCMTHIVKICANVDAMNIIRVTRHREDLEDFTSKTEDEVVIIPDSNSTVQEQMNALAALMEEIENYIRNLPGVSDSLFEGHAAVSVDFNKFVVWLSLLDDRLPQLGLETTINWKARMATTYLQRMVLAYQGFSAFPSHAVINRFLTGLGNDDRSDLGELVRKQVADISSLPSGEPKTFQKLVQLMNTQFETEPDSRVMVFVQQREYCLLGMPLIEKMTCKEVAYLTGVNSGRELGGMSLSDQQQQLQIFNSGKAPIMLATSVADEGVDVGRCNLVIKYDDVSNDIAHVQRRGRARQMKSRCILITPHSHKHVAESRNSDKIHWVEQALMYIGAMIPNARRRMFAEAIANANEARIEEAERQALMKEEMAPASADYTVHCKKCNRALVDSKFVRAATSIYTVCDESYWSRVTCKPISAQQREVKYNRMPGDAVCHMMCNGPTDHGACNSKVGIVVNLKGIPFPVLGCKELFFQNKLDKNIRVTKKQWKDILSDLFFPPELTSKEMLSMANAPEQPEMSAEAKLAAFEAYCDPDRSD
uniref:Helicase ATP-binding domain-containing protein n=1 Tax=Panagrellus redivivus TaxID=6233 RepID=A0A7E5A098_PANRE